MSAFDIKGKRITVIGAARSGIAVANAVVRLGGKAKISEFKARAQVEKELSGWNENKIIVRFWICAIILAMLTLTTLKIR